MSERVSGAAGVSGEDLSMLESQLGRKPSGVLRVERYCPAGHPQVIRYYPLSLSPEAEVLSPFPTLFWLTCPSLIRQVSEFESYGWTGSAGRLSCRGTGRRLSGRAGRRSIGTRESAASGIGIS